MELQRSRVCSSSPHSTNAPPPNSLLILKSFILASWTVTLQNANESHLMATITSSSATPPHKPCSFVAWELRMEEATARIRCKLRSSRITVRRQPSVIVCSVYTLTVSSVSVVAVCRNIYGDTITAAALWAGPAWQSIHLSIYSLRRRPNNVSNFSPINYFN